MNDITNNNGFNSLLKGKSQSNKIFFKFKDISIRRKIKARACKSILYMLNDYFEKLPNLSNVQKLKNISPKFTNNTSLKFNRIYMNFKIFELFTYKFEEKDNVSSNSTVIKQIMESHPNDKILNMKFKDLFIKYFESNYFKEDLAKLEDKEHKLYLEKYNKLAKGFIDYYFP